MLSSEITFEVHEWWSFWSEVRKKALKRVIRREAKMLSLLGTPTEQLK